MADSPAQDRTLPASPRRLQKAHGEGQVARSRDLGHFGALAAAIVALAALAPALAGMLQGRLAAALQFDHRLLAASGSMTGLLADGATLLLLVALPVGALLAAVGAGCAVAAGGWVWSWHPLAPRFGRLDPLAGIGRLASKQQWLDTLKACAVALTLGGAGTWYLHARVDAFAGALALPLPQAIAHLAAALLYGLMLLAGALGAFALVDVPLQRWLHRQRLRMSHHELKQEHKEQEGSAEVKARRRARMRELASRRMLAAVPHADLVVMNPTHYAVALKYDEATMAAPRVVAKGADLLALRIRDIAREAQVPVLRSPPLARALYAHAEIDREIPAALFSAVAQVLAWLYQLRAAAAGRAAMPAEPAVELPPGLDPQQPAGDASTR